MTGKSVSSLVRAVAELATDLDRRNSMGNAAKIWATRTFSVESMITTHDSNYQNLLHR